MKQYLLLGLALSALFLSASAQKTKKKHVNRFDTTLAKKHELSVSFGFSRGGSYNLVGDRNDGPSFAIEYARVFKANHFLRTGLRVTHNTTQYREEMPLPASPADLNPHTVLGDLPIDYAVYPFSTGGFTTDNTYSSVFIGYEYGVGRKRFRFTFGADLHIGYNNRSIVGDETLHEVERTYDSASQFFQYNIDVLQSGKISSTSHNMFMSLSPRLGLRYDFTPRFALGVTFTPQLGFSQRVGYTETVSGSRPPSFHHAKSQWFTGQNIDLRLIFKLGKS